MIVTSEIKIKTDDREASELVPCRVNVSSESIVTYTIAKKPLPATNATNLTDAFKSFCKDIGIEYNPGEGGRTLFPIFEDGFQALLYQRYSDKFVLRPRQYPSEILISLTPDDRRRLASNLLSKLTRVIRPKASARHTNRSLKRVNASEGPMEGAKIVKQVHRKRTGRRPSGDDNATKPSTRVNFSTEFSVKRVKIDQTQLLRGRISLPSTASDDHQEREPPISGPSGQMNYVEADSAYQQENGSQFSTANGHTNDFDLDDFDIDSVNDAGAVDSDHHQENGPTAIMYYSSAAHTGRADSSANQLKRPFIPNPTVPTPALEPLELTSFFDDP